MKIITIEEMKLRQQTLEYSNDQLALLSGVPLATIEGIYGGIIKNPSQQILEKLDVILREKEPLPYVFCDGADSSKVAEAVDPYYIPKRIQGEYTVEDYEALPDERRVELIDGVIYDMSAPSTAHQFITLEVGTQLKFYIRSKGGECIPFIAPTDVQIDMSPFTVVQPDVFVVCNRDLISRKRIIGAPDLIVEVLSSSTRKKDTEIKLNKYKICGVKEYWLVDADEQRVIVYDFADSKKPVTIYPFTDTVPVGIFDGDCQIDFKPVLEAFGIMDNVSQ